MRLRMLIAHAVYWLAKPVIEAEAKRIAEAEATYAGAVALTISETKLANAVTRLSDQDSQVLQLVGEAFEARDLRLNAMAALLMARVDVLPGERRPARDDAAIEVVPPQKLH